METGSGIRNLKLSVADGKVYEARANMGTPQYLEPRQLPMREYVFTFTPVSMGNPHAVMFLEPKRTAGAAIEELPMWEIGPYFETHASSNERVNAEFVEVMDEHTLRMRVWERGSGETMACGTGACAAAVAAIVGERVEGNTVTVELRGGRLRIEWDRETNTVFMTGPAETVFSGEI